MKIFKTEKDYEQAVTVYNTWKEKTVARYTEFDVEADDQFGFVKFDTDPKPKTDPKSKTDSDDIQKHKRPTMTTKKLQTGVFEDPNMKGSNFSKKSAKVMNLKKSDTTIKGGNIGSGFFKNKLISEANKMKNPFIQNNNDLSLSDHSEKSKHTSGKNLKMGKSKSEIQDCAKLKKFDLEPYDIDTFVRLVQRKEYSTGINLFLNYPDSSGQTAMHIA